MPGELTTAVEVLPPGTELEQEDVAHEYRNAVDCDVQCDMAAEDSRVLVADLDALEKELAEVVSGELAVGIIGDYDLNPPPERFDLSVQVWSILPLSDVQQQRVIDTVNSRATSIQFATYVAING